MSAATKIGTFKAHLIDVDGSELAFENTTANDAQDLFAQALGHADYDALAAARGQTAQELADCLVVYEIEEPEAAVEVKSDFFVYEIKETGKTDGEVIE